MKEFEKHEGSICDSINVDCPPYGCDYCTEIQHVGWKAALRWLQTQNDVYIDKYVSEYINKELGE